jgi:hypothetical protein
LGTFYFADAARVLDDGHGLAQTLAAVKDGNGRGPLHFAARGGCDELCKYMIDELKLPIDVRDNDGTFSLVLVPSLFVLFVELLSRA